MCNEIPCTCGAHEPEPNQKEEEEEATEENGDGYVKLKGENGAEIYLVGTESFNSENVEKVVEVLKKLKPTTIVVQLDTIREFLMTWNKEMILEEGERFRSEKIKCLLRERGLFRTVTYLFLLRTTTHKIKDTGLIPGEQFRAPFVQLHKEEENFTLYLGDRPVDITLRRAMYKLWPWQCLFISFNTFIQGFLERLRKFSNCEHERSMRVERRDDVIEELALKTNVLYPALGKSILEERRIFLAYSLQHAASCEGCKKVLGIVDAQHIPWIQDHWEEVAHEDVNDILCEPKRGVFGKISTGITGFGCISMYGVGRLFEKFVILFEKAKNRVDVARHVCVPEETHVDEK